MVVVVFDLDDTLYFEKGYVASGFKYVSEYIGEKAGIPCDGLFKEMSEAFENGVRSNTFDLLLSKHREIEHLFRVEELVNLYRSHKPSINLIPEADDTIRFLKSKGFTLGIISDGLLETQTRKIQSLKLSTRFNTIILTDTWGSDYWKPHTRAFKEMEMLHLGKRCCFVYVADNPAKDFKPAKECGWDTIRLRFPGQLHFLLEPANLEHQPGIECRSFQCLTEVLLRHFERKTP